uniref:Uncharacterized protein n=1 Tax=Ditylenchus dipsaci TaxID=166011 RepID=A0A915EWM4_9BILA
MCVPITEAAEDVGKEGEHHAPVAPSQARSTDLTFVTMRNQTEEVQQIFPSVSSSGSQKFSPATAMGPFLLPAESGSSEVKQVDQTGIGGVSETDVVQTEANVSVGNVPTVVETVADGIEAGTKGSVRQ